MVFDKSKQFAKEYWTGDSRDGVLRDGDGFHYYKFDSHSKIMMAYEVYERDDGEAISTPLPELLGVNWLADNGEDLLDSLEFVEKDEFDYVSDLAKSR